MLKVNFVIDFVICLCAIAIIAIKTILTTHLHNDASPEIELNMYLLNIHEQIKQNHWPNSILTHIKELMNSDWIDTLAGILNVNFVAYLFFIYM